MYAENHNKSHKFYISINLILIFDSRCYTTYISHSLASSTTRSCEKKTTRETKAHPKSDEQVEEEEEENKK
jgi:hypothetical protein